MPASAQSDDPAAEMTKGERKLAMKLEGRVAGDPVECLPTSRNVRSSIIDKTAIVYEQGSTVYVNYTRSPEYLDDDDYLVVRSFSTRLCRTDTVTTRDRSGNFYSGNLQLTQFIPYKRIEDEG
ncbi:hypothetical protein DL238_04600 [Alteriqipengyuania lutimaris]|uniref:Uncharacterized protein n=1 Tax=Alteriqipengyuania lutimaris TaxID=1538146 RepID=A0A395LNT0_9SPHN|nr:hypothetical protein DL238_04600 [Alteriqipengyuania lutimaris]